MHCLARPHDGRAHGPYVDLFQSQGGSLVMVAKGNRSQQVTDACRKHGGFYLGSIGGPAAILAKNSSSRSRSWTSPNPGRWRMEAVRKIYVENLAFIIVDDKGNDFFADFWALRTVVYTTCTASPRLVLSLPAAPLSSDLPPQTLLHLREGLAAQAAKLAFLDGR